MLLPIAVLAGMKPVVSIVSLSNNTLHITAHHTKSAHQTSAHDPDGRVYSPKLVLLTVNHG
jgi:hypothetical protein